MSLLLLEPLALPESGTVSVQIGWAVRNCLQLYDASSSLNRPVLGMTSNSLVCRRSWNFIDSLLPSWDTPRAPKQLTGTFDREALGLLSSCALGTDHTGGTIA